MSYRDDDQSASTAQFQAFAQNRADDLPPAWEMKAPRSKIGMLAVVVIVVAILAGVIGYLLV